MRRALLATLLLTLAAVCHAADPIAGEIDRLDAALKGIDPQSLPKEVQPLIAEQQKALERARKAASPEYRLYRLRDAFVGIETLSFVAKEKASAESLDRFTQLWTARRARFEAKAPQPRAQQLRGTLLQRALAESASTRAERLFRASLPYAKASAPWSGVYYLGEAEGNLRFREFVMSVAGPAGGAAEKTPSLAGLRGAYESLDRDTLTFFGGDVTNRAVIPVSARLKEANELLDARRADGATLLLVEARLALSRRGGPAGSYPAGAAASGGSIRALLDAWADDEESPMKEKIRAEVVPFFASLGLPTAAARTVPAAVTVTLVRWPYT